MQHFASKLAMLWHCRKSRDTPARRQARAAVSHLKPAVVITGGSRGIGLAFARVFLEHGATVLIVARTPSDLQTAAQSLAESERARCFTLVCDISTPDAFAVIVQDLLKRGYYLDCLVCNAAIGLSGPFTRATHHQIDQLAAVNIASLTRLMRHALPSMIARGEGGIITVASLGGYVPGPHQAMYYASKAFVLSLSEAIASEVSGLGVRITAVAPGPVATGFHADMGADAARYRLLLPELSSEHVARSGYRAFTLGQRVVVPGLLYRLVFVCLRVLPHPLSVPLTGWLLKNPERAPRNVPR